MVSEQYNIDDLQKFLETGKVLLLLCDTIYGLVAKAPEGHFALQQIKGRPETKPFLQLYGNLEQLEKSPWKMPPEDFLKYWPGPLTCILSSKQKGYLSRTKPYDSQAVRIPEHKLLQDLCLRLEAPLYSTSANHSGEAIINQKEQLMKIFALEIAEQFVIPYFPKENGKDATMIASTIVDTRLTPPKILRQGASSFSSAEHGPK